VLVTPPAVVYATGLLVICGPQRQLLDLHEIVGLNDRAAAGRSHSLKKITEFANLQMGRTAPIPVNPIIWKRMQNVVSH
jgi:hypothetical protein